MNKTITNWSKLGYTAAIVFFLVNLVHNYFQYPDLDKFIAYSLIAACVFAISYQHNKSKKFEGSFNYFEDKVREKWESL